MISLFSDLPVFALFDIAFVVDAFVAVVTVVDAFDQASVAYEAKKRENFHFCFLLIDKFFQFHLTSLSI